MVKLNIHDKLSKEKKGVISVIKYEGDNETFVWKHPIEGFNMGSQLIVHESQEALFFRDGKALDLFGAGRYTLSTQNMPILGKFYKIPADSDEIFHSEVYFVNLTTQMGVKWGTDSKIRMFDPASGLHIEIGACGNFNIRVTDSRKLILKIVGTSNLLSQSELVSDNVCSAKTSSVVGKFRALVISKVKQILAQAIKSNHINILEVDEHIGILSEYVQREINEGLDEYGLYIPEFYITSIMMPDDDPNFRKLKEQFAEKTLKIRQEEILQAEAEAARSRKMVEAQTEAQLKLVNAQAEAEAYKLQAYAEAEEMRVKGYNYQQETARQVGLEAMKNGIVGSGSGGGIGDIAGLGMAFGAMGGVMKMTKGVLDPFVNPADGMDEGTSNNDSVQDTDKFDSSEECYGWDCTCGKNGISSKFCPDCGKKRPEKIQHEGWNCTCGRKKITSRFCPDCGKERMDTNE